MLTNNQNIFQEFAKRIGVEVNWSTIDEVVVADNNVLRPVKGYAFEILFDEVADKFLKCAVKAGTGGDTDIDRILIDCSGAEVTLQLKTCASSTIIDKVRFGVNLHKTHGQEKRPQNLYPKVWPCPFCPHDGEEFPDYLVILHPDSGMLIIPKSNIPENRVHRGHFADPAYFEWNSEWLNRWDLLGFTKLRGKSLERRTVARQEKLPKISQLVHLTDEELVRMWLRPENFRALEMNLKGNLREPALGQWLKESGIESRIPNIGYSKYDRVTTRGSRVQIKGLSKGLTANNIFGVEVMGSHRQGVDRVYSDTDFDYLGLVIDPGYIPADVLLEKSKYHYCLIPLKALPLHYKNAQWHTTNRIYPNCKFIVGYDGRAYYLKPFVDYRVNVSFRESGPWYIDQIPPRF